MRSSFVFIQKIVLETKYLMIEGSMF